MHDQQCKASLSPQFKTTRCATLTAARPEGRSSCRRITRTSV
jgi:hypothetical protein